MAFVFNGFQMQKTSLINKGRRDSALPKRGRRFLYLNCGITDFIMAEQEYNMTNKEKIQDLLDRKEKLKLGGGIDKISKQHEAGKLTARERLGLLFDEGTFLEYNIFAQPRVTTLGKGLYAPGDGVVTGYGKIDGRGVYAYAHDFTVLGGAAGEVQNTKIKRITDLAYENKKPVFALFDSAGGRIQEGGDDASGYLYYNNVRNSGVVPQFSAIMGACAGSGVYAPVLTDFLFTVDKTCSAYLTGPNAIEKATGEKIDTETLGGAMVHCSKSGFSHFFCSDDYDCIAKMKRLLSYFPQNCDEMPPVTICTDDVNRRCEELNEIVPEEKKKAYDMKLVIRAIADHNDFFETMEYFAPNMITGFIRLGGYPVGIVANQPKFLAGSIDINASDKAARFIRTCDCFNIPLLSLVDAPGYLPGTAQEHNGIIRHGGKMLYAWSEATVPIMSVATHKVYGGAKSGMCNIQMGPDYRVAWPHAERAIMAS
jgi:acetyl-CoA carboxylase carboxyltransferase component